MSCTNCAILGTRWWKHQHQAPPKRLKRQRKNRFMKVNRILIEFHAPTRLVSIAFIGILSLLPLKLLSAGGRVALGVHGPCVHRSRIICSRRNLPPNIGGMEKYSSRENCAKYMQRPERTRPPPPRLHKLAELEKNWPPPAHPRANYARESERCRSIKKYHVAAVAVLIFNFPPLLSLFVEIMPRVDSSSK
jgi:hypothetical protein